MPCFFDYIQAILLVFNVVFQDTIRQQQAAAAEKRLAEQEKRGIGNVNAVKRQQKLAEERDKRMNESQNDNNPGLRVNIKVVHSTYKKLINCIVVLNLKN